METLVEATNRFRAAGYDRDFFATDGGLLHCTACGQDHEPDAMVVDEMVRFEGISDPDDEAILIAMSCACGVRGLYSPAYGPDAPRADAEVLRRLPRT